MIFRRHLFSLLGEGGRTLEGFTESLSYELASQNIVVKIVEPGGGDTAFHARASKLTTGDGGIDSYGPFLERANAALGKLAKHMTTPERIAAVIYGGRAWCVAPLRCNFFHYCGRPTC